MYVNHTDFDPEKLVLLDTDSKKDFLIGYNYKPSKNPIVKILRIKSPQVKSTGLIVNSHEVKISIADDTLTFFLNKLQSSLEVLFKRKNIILEKTDFNIYAEKNNPFIMKSNNTSYPDYSDVCNPYWGDLEKATTIILTPYISFDSISFEGDIGFVKSYIDYAEIESINKSN